MGSNIPILYKTVKDRLAADTGAGGLFAGAGASLVTGCYYARGPMAADAPTTVFPMLVFHHTGRTNDSDTRTREWVDEIALEVLVEFKPSGTSVDPYARMTAIIARIEGDWEDQTAGTQPTYGLDRYVPGAMGSSGWDCGLIEIVDMVFIDDQEGIFRGTVNLRMRSSKRAA